MILCSDVMFVRRRLICCRTIRHSNCVTHNDDRPIETNITFVYYVRHDVRTRACNYKNIFANRQTHTPTECRTEALGMSSCQCASWPEEEGCALQLQVGWMGRQRRRRSRSECVICMKCARMRLWSPSSSSPSPLNRSHSCRKYDYFVHIIVRGVCARSSDGCGVLTFGAIHYYTIAHWRSPTMLRNAPGPSMCHRRTARHQHHHRRAATTACHGDASTSYSTLRTLVQLLLLC